MKLVEVQIRGDTSLLQHRFSEESEANPSTRKVLVNHGILREAKERIPIETDKVLSSRISHRQANPRSWQRA
jgi:hypothetical protein